MDSQRDPGKTHITKNAAVNPASATSPAGDG